MHRFKASYNFRYQNTYYGRYLGTLSTSKKRGST